MSSARRKFVLRLHLIGLAAALVLTGVVVVLLRDSSADLAGALPIALPGVALFYGAGLLVQNRVSKRQRPDAVPAAERETV